MSKPLKTVEEILEDLIYDTPNSYGYPPDFEPDFKQAKANLYQLMLSLVEDFTHYHRTCQNCGKNWWGLHCPHDGYQNPCPECKSMPVVVNQHYCDCDFVIPVDELKAKLSEHFNGEGV